MNALKTYSDCYNSSYIGIINRDSYRKYIDSEETFLEKKYDNLLKKFLFKKENVYCGTYYIDKYINSFLTYTDINKQILGVDNLPCTLKIDTVKGDDLVLKFKNSFIIAYKREGEGYIYDNDELGIYLYGEDLQELKDDFEENIIVAWELYVDCDESELNPGAIKLRNKLKKLIEKV